MPRSPRTDMAYEEQPLIASVDIQEEFENSARLTPRPRKMQPFPIRMMMVCWKTVFGIIVVGAWALVIGIIVLHRSGALPACCLDRHLVSRDERSMPCQPVTSTVI